MIGFQTKSKFLTLTRLRRITSSAQKAPHRSCNWQNCVREAFSFLFLNFDSVAKTNPLSPTEIKLLISQLETKTTMPIVHQFEAQEIPDAPASATNFVEEPKSKSPFSQLKKLVKGKKKQVTFVDDDSLAQHIPDVELLERRPRAPTFADIRDQLVPPISPDQQVVAIEVEEEEIECEKPEEIVTRSAKGPFKAIRGFLSTSSRSSTEIVEDSPVIQVEPTPEGTIKPTTFAIIRNFLDGSSTEVNVEEKEEEVIAREQRSALINRLLTRAAAPNANQVTPRRASRKGLFIGINYYGTGSELRGNLYVRCLRRMP